MSDDDASQTQSPREELPPELVDPITLTLVEEAVMITTCGHSFSAGSIGAWLKRQQQEGAVQTCPVCKTRATGNPPVVPNWALRTAAERYKEKMGKRLERSSSGSDIASAPQVTIDLSAYDPPAKPSAPPAPDVGLGSAPSFHPEDDIDINRNTSSSSSPPPPPNNVNYNAGGGGGGGGEGGGGCDCNCNCLGERPTGPRGCCAWECDDCGVCKMADDCKNCWLMFPLTTLTCNVSFGDMSNWYSRSIFGVLYPVWVVFVLLLMVADMVLVCVIWTLWSCLVPIGMLFFWFTHYFCPSINRKVVSLFGSYSFFVGQICPS